jgi:release factor glutamine methyltransferase
MSSANSAAPDSAPFNSVMTVRDALREAISRLRAAKIPSHTLAAELLLLHATTRDRTWIYSHPEETLSPEIVASFFAQIEKRIQGTPVQHLTGKQEFWGLQFEVTPDVLIPRPETEHLIEVALDRLAVREIRAGRPPRLSGENLRIVDVGTGSGCIAIALAKELPDAKLYATDISKPALVIAQRNAIRLGLADRIHFLESSLLDSLISTSAAFDLVICNPPYIGLRERNSLQPEVLRHEPALALFGGEEGCELYGALISQAALLLKPEGLLVLELGQGSLPAVYPLLETPPWTTIGINNDLAGIPRVLSAERTNFSS